MLLRWPGGLYLYYFCYCLDVYVYSEPDRHNNKAHAIIYYRCASRKRVVQVREAVELANRDHYYTPIRPFGPGPEFNAELSYAHNVL